MINKAGNLMKHLVSTRTFSRILRDCTVVNAEPGRLDVEMVVEEQHENPHNALHGGFAATLVDSISTLALQNTERADPGVTVDLHCSFLKSVKHGETILIQSRVLKVGNRLAFLEVDIRSKISGDLLITGSHTKALKPLDKN